MEDVRKRAMQVAKKNATNLLIFHWRGGYLTRDVIIELVRLLEEEATKKEKHVKVSLNLSQAVVQVRFEKDFVEAVGEQVELEEANEGELL